MDVLLVLHAHLPWVRDPVHPGSIEERWLFEALWESYLPLLAVADRAAERGQAGAFTLSLSPTLLAMLGDARLRAGFTAHLEALLAVARDEIRRSDAARAAALEDHVARAEAARARLDEAGGDLAAAFGEHHRFGTIELVTTAATHPVLPACRSAGHVAAQLAVARAALERAAGVAPAGLWLPECAYDPRLDPQLVGAGVGWTVLDGHGIDLATPRSPLGVFAPALTPAGLAVFGREPGAARRVWSRKHGYPGDPAYREFHRDLVDEVPHARLGPLAPPPGARSPIGLRPYRVTGREVKELYDPRAAAERIATHARDFVEEAERALEGAPRAGDAPPLLVAPYDAELFGHWWWEGPAFLDQVLATLHRHPTLQATTPAARLARHPMLPVVVPAISTWGEGGHVGVWAAEDTAPMLRSIHRAERAVDAAYAAATTGPSAASTAGATSGPAAVARRARHLAARELMLGAASDWAFLVRTGTNVPYARQRAAEHLDRAVDLARRARAPHPDDALHLAAIASEGPPLAWFPGDVLDAAWGLPAAEE